MTALDLEAIRGHVELLHRLAAPLAADNGTLVVATFGQAPDEIDPKTGKLGRPLTPKVKHFKIGDIDAMVKEVVKLGRERDRNVYAPLAVFSAGVTGTKKGSEAEIAAILGLVADFDDDDADRWAERLPLPPNYVIESSTGRFQPFFLFDQPAPFGVVKPLAMRLKLFAGCDHGTADLSHVWRIPGTLNWPNALKIAAGRPREPQIAKVIKACNGALCALDDLSAALGGPEAAEEEPFKQKTSGRDRHQQEEPPADLEAILAQLPEWLIKRLETEGADRSKALFTCIAKLIEHNFDDATIESILRAFPNGPGSKYSGRGDLAAEITRVRAKTAAGRKARGKPATHDDEVSAADIAAEQARSEARLGTLIADFNKLYAIVNEGGKVWVFTWRDDPALHREVLERISHPDFRRMYENKLLGVIKTESGKTFEVKKTWADWWLRDPKRRQYLGGVVFDPTNRAPADYWNLWRGFSVEPNPGDWSLMQDHILKIICAGDSSLADYFLDWTARMFQQPDRPGEVAIVLRGVKGAGKSIIGRWVKGAFGQHGLQIVHSSQLVGRFNAHLRDCILLFADEAFYAGDKQGEGALKGLITEPFFAIEGKHQNVVTVPNLLHIILSSNNDWVVPASIDERRYAVFDVADNRVDDLAYFRAIDEQMQNGGLAAMIHDLLKRDISQFEFRRAPKTIGLTTQKTLSLPSLEKWWMAVLARGFLCKSRHGAPWFREWQDFYSTEILCRSYIQWCDENRPYDRRDRAYLGRLMSKLYSPKRPGEGIAQPVYELDTVDAAEIKLGRSLDQASIFWQDRPHGYLIGELQEARVRFTEIYPGIETEWGLAP